MAMNLSHKLSFYLQVTLFETSYKLQCFSYLSTKDFPLPSGKKLKNTHCSFKFLSTRTPEYINGKKTEKKKSSEQEKFQFQPMWEDDRGDQAFYSSFIP